MLVAIFISGRLSCYETDLIKCLIQMSKTDTIHLFGAINSEYNTYFNKAHLLLGQWLKIFRYQPYVKPPHKIFENVPYNVLSCFYNDQKAFEMIKEYELNNSIKYDIICKFRADITFEKPDNFSFSKYYTDSKTLYSCIPPDPIHFFGIREFPANICDAFAFGSSEVMSHYCKTYDFICKTLIERNGDYRVWYEPTLTESFLNVTIDKETFYSYVVKANSIFKNSPFAINYFSCPYILNPNRTKIKMSLD